MLNCLRRLEAGQRGERGNRREEVRIRNHELLLNDAVVTQRGQGVREREAVVKDSEPGADHGIWTRVLGAGSGRPRDSDARRDITPVVDVGLRFVAQPQTQCEIGTHTPVVAHEQSYVEMTCRQRGIPGVDAELRGAAAQFADARRREAESLEEQRAAVSFDGSDVLPSTGSSTRNRLPLPSTLSTLT